MLKAAVWLPKVEALRAADLLASAIARLDGPSAVSAAAAVSNAAAKQTIVGYAGAFREALQLAHKATQRDLAASWNK